MRRIIYRPEEALQKTIVEWLELELEPPAIFWATANQRGTRKEWEQRLMKSLGVRAGVPDLFVLHDGKLLGVELKAPAKMLKSGKPSKAKAATSGAQDEFHAHLKAAGGDVTVCRSLEEVRSFLSAWSVPFRWRVR